MKNEISYGMFSHHGNMEVHGIVGAFRALKGFYPSQDALVQELRRNLSLLAKNPKFQEATDTVVVEAAFIAITE